MDSEIDLLRDLQGDKWTGRWGDSLASGQRGAGWEEGAVGAERNGGGGGGSVAATAVL